MDLQPSDEQINIINALKDNNVIVDAVAGSGKTTTNIFIAHKYNDRKILLLTYNKKLKFETRERIINNGLTNIEVHTYHSFCVKYYDRKCYTDTTIIKMLNRNQQCLSRFDYDMFILDEAQDINNTYYRLFCKIYRDNKGRIDDNRGRIDDNRESNSLSIKNICLLGDKMQSIYDFNGADSRFLTLADQVFNLNKLQWVKLTLSQSFRITTHMAEFINKCMLKEDRIVSNKETCKDSVKYYILDAFGEIDIIMDEIIDLLNQYKYEDIFVLAPSVKSVSTPVRILANMMTERDIPIYVPSSDEEKLTNEVLKDKIVFSTFHQAKGLERKIVIVFGFDESYFIYYKNDADATICPNELYVACTRAKEQLIMVHHQTNEYLPFIRKYLVDVYAKVKITRYKPTNKKNKKSNVKKISVTDLVKHLATPIIMKACEYLDVKKIKEQGEKIKMKCISDQGKTIETVSDINGTAIPSLYEYMKTKKITMYDNIINNPKTHDLLGFSGNIYDKLEKYIGKMNESQINLYDYIDKIKDFDVCLNFTNDENIHLHTMNEKGKHEIMIRIHINAFDDETIIDEDNCLISNICHGVIIPKISGILTYPTLLKIANLWNSHVSGYDFKLKQIKKYDWVNKDDMTQCYRRLDKVINGDCEFEKYLECTYVTGKYDVTIMGAIDIIEKKSMLTNKESMLDQNKIILWEIKCVEELKQEHMLQLAIYSYLYKMNKGKFETENVLYNVLTDEMVEVKVQDATKLLDYLIKSKYDTEAKLSDTKFINSIKKIII